MLLRLTGFELFLLRWGLGLLCPSFFFFLLLLCFLSCALVSFLCAWLLALLLLVNPFEFLFLLSFDFGQYLRLKAQECRVLDGSSRVVVDIVHVSDGAVVLWDLFVEVIGDMDRGSFLCVMLRLDDHNRPVDHVNEAGEIQRISQCLQLQVSGPVPADADLREVGLVRLIKEKWFVVRLVLLHLFDGQISVFHVLVFVSVQNIGKAAEQTVAVPDHVMDGDIILLDLIFEFRKVGHVLRCIRPVVGGAMLCLLLFLCSTV